MPGSFTDNKHQMYSHHLIIAIEHGPTQAKHSSGTESLRKMWARTVHRRWAGRRFLLVWCVVCAVASA
jgi:hypothetical protein